MLLHLLCVAAAAAATAAAAAAERPHILLIVADNLGYNDVGYNNVNGSNKQLTPTLDALASEGIILSDYHVFKFCSPTRASFMTGFIPYHHGVTAVLHDKDALPARYIWLPQLLQAHGGYE